MRYRQVREDVILPFVLRVLGEEISDLKRLLVRPPEELVEPGAKRRKNRSGRKAERDKLAPKQANVPRLLGREINRTVWAHPRRSARYQAARGARFVFAS